MKILIILFSYNRPRLLRQALESIQDSSYKDYRVALIDDGSNFDALEVAKEFELTELQWVPTNSTQADKEARGGSNIGEMANNVTLNGDHDICIMLCDDDAIYEGYLENLNNYFTDNPNVMYAYSKVAPYDPNTEKSKGLPPKDWWLNKEGPINPYCQVDASQVAWRTACFTEGGVRFPSPQTAALDAHVYAQLFNVYGDCQPMNCIGQYKGVWDGQLGAHGSYNTKDTPLE